jgi:hypothetical protein
VDIQWAELPEVCRPPYPGGRHVDQRRQKATQAGSVPRVRHRLRVRLAVVAQGAEMSPAADGVNAVERADFALWALPWPRGA